MTICKSKWTIFKYLKFCYENFINPTHFLPRTN